MSTTNTTNDNITYKVRLSRARRDDLTDIQHALYKRGEIRRLFNNQIDAQAAMEIVILKAKEALGIN